MTAPRLLVLFLIALLASGCPKSDKRRVLGPVPPVPTDGNAQARTRFLELQSRYKQSGQNVTVEMEKIVRDYPNDPVVPYALLYAGMSAVRAGEYKKAVKNLEKLDREPADEAVHRRGRLYIGIAHNYLGEHGKALTALRTVAEAVNSDDQNERAEWLAAMAEATAATGKTRDAILHYDAWFQVGRPAERSYVVARIRALSGELDDSTLATTYGALERREGPAAAILGARLAALYTAGGDLDRAEEIREEIERARRNIGLLPETSGDGGGDPRRIGAILPLSGRRNRIGDRSMRGLAMAAGVYGKAPTGQARDTRFQIAVRDSVSGSGAATQAVDQLVAEDSIALVGPMDVDAVSRAAERAGQSGVPLVSLSPRADSHGGDESRFVFHAVHSAEQRARALARYALDHDIKDFAIFGPKNAYGRAVGNAFKEEVERLGGTIIVRVAYPPKTTSFSDYTKELNKPWQAVFVPDHARRLALVTPALAAGNFKSRPVEKRKGRSRGARKVLVLSTAELVNDKYLLSAGRYSWGAVFAPGFYPDRKDDIIGPFVDDYFSAFGALPTALEAYAYDAALAVRAAVAAGAKNREEVAARLAGSKVDGLTGAVEFDSARLRGDGGVLYRVEELSSGDYELRALR